MSNLAKYSVLQARPSRDRHEIVTVGLVVSRDNAWDVRILPEPSKILALNPEFPPSGLVNIQRIITAMLEGSENFDVARARLARHGNDPGLQSYVGQFAAEDSDEYERKVSDLMRFLVLPPNAHKTLVKAQPKVNRLRTRLKDRFRAQGLLAKTVDEIGEHKVVERFPINAEQGLYAEFALRNGVMNITETVDFTVHRMPRKVLEAQAKTLILSEAAKQFGANTKRNVIVSGSYLREAAPSINLLSDHADLFEIRSEEDMSRYFDMIERAAASESASSERTNVGVS
jgi:hypothetical protein